MNCKNLIFKNLKFICEIEQINETIKKGISKGYKLISVLVEK